MKTTTKYILAAGAVAVVGYLVWKNRKPKQAMSNGGRSSGESDGGQDIRKFPRETLSNDIPPAFSVTGGMLGSGTTYRYNAKNGSFSRGIVVHCIKAPCNDMSIEISKVEYIKAWKNKVKHEPKPLTEKDKQKFRMDCTRELSKTKMSLDLREKKIDWCVLKKSLPSIPMSAYGTPQIVGTVDM
ncbi:MAG: hypothetical protein ACYSTX_03255 [Planctomycetota bacterium]|jgi:hypothetical protein